MIVLVVEPQEFPVSAFRIYIECVAEISDVRLSGRGDVYVGRDGVTVLTDDTTQNLPKTTTAYDRVDDRTFPEDVC